MKYNYAYNSTVHEENISDSGMTGHFLEVESPCVEKSSTKKWSSCTSTRWNHHHLITHPY